MNTQPALQSATYDVVGPTVVVTSLHVTHPAVTSEALRWSTGVRGPVVAAAEMDGADITAYVNQCLIVGAQAIATAGGAQDTYNLEQLVQDVGVRTAETTEQAKDATSKVVIEASAVIKEASSEAQKALSEAGGRARKEFGESVAAARKELQEQLTRLLGGDDPELLTRLRPTLERFGADLAKRADQHATDVVEKATKAFDPDDPTSPLGRHTAKLDRRHQALTEQVRTQHDALAAKVDELTQAVNVARATAATRNVTNLKGADYEARIHPLMESIAIGLGDEYADTSMTEGHVARSKKGDGLLTVEGGRARVVVEVHDSHARRSWGPYLDEAERNRRATASLGIVPTVEQNGGESIRVLGLRRIVMAFDPERDDPAFLRIAIQLLRTSAIAATRGAGSDGTQIAAERLTDALQLLIRLDEISKTAGSIRKGADKVDTSANTLRSDLSRLLLQAQTALAGATADDEDLPGTAVGVA